MAEPKRGKSPNWNEIADFYSAFAFCELDDTRTYLNAIGLVGDESVLDVCCGPGRISVLAAERGCRVDGIDSSENMLDHARKNAEAAGVADRCTFTLLDWERALPSQNVQRHDVVIASRCRAMFDVAKLSALANRTAAVQIFADAPSIPALEDVLFDGCKKSGEGGPAFDHGAPEAGFGGPAGGPAGGPGAPGGPAGRPPFGPGAPAGPGAPGGPFGRPAPAGRVPGAYKKLIDKVYEQGFDPNVRILPERFRKTFATADEANAWVCALDPERSRGNEERVAHNVAPLLRPVEGGVEFMIATAAAIIWWDVRGAAAFNPWLQGLE